MDTRERRAPELALLIFSLVVFAACSSPAPSDEVASSSALGSDDLGYDVLVIAGQSNAVGAGFGDPNDAPDLNAYDARIFQIGRTPGVDRTIVPMSEPLHNWIVKDHPDWDRKGFAVPFARRYAKDVLAPDRKLLLVPAAMSSTSIVQWSPTADKPKVETALYTDMKARIQLALSEPGSRLVGVLWHQGEGDIPKFSHPPLPQDASYYDIVPDAGAYAERMATLIRAIRTDFPQPACVPFLIGEPVPHWDRADPNGAPDPGILSAKAAFKSVLIALAQRLECVAYVESTGLLGNLEETNQIDGGGNIHFGARSAAAYGARYFVAYQALLAEKASTPSTPDPGGGGRCVNRGLLTPPAAPVPAGVAPEVKQIYDELLGGIGSHLDGAIYLTNVHVQQNYPFSAIRRDFVNGVTEVKDKVNYAYQSYLHRWMDDADWSAVKSALLAGQTIQEMEANIANSDECRP